MHRKIEELSELNLNKNLEEIYFSEHENCHYSEKFHGKFGYFANRDLFGSKLTDLLLVNSGVVALELAIKAAFYPLYFENTSNVKIGIPVLADPMVKWAAERAECVEEIRYLDVDPKTFCIKDIPSDLDAVIWVHTGGLISEKTEQMFKKCRNDFVIIIEDISLAYGSSFNGKKAGSTGFVAGSLFGITRFEGGIVGTRSRENCEFVRAMINQTSPSIYARVMDGHDPVKLSNKGYNYRTSEFTAAVALEKLKNLDKEIAARRVIADEYDNALSKIGIQSVEKELGCVTGLYKYMVRTKSAHRLNDLMEAEGFSFTGLVHDKLLDEGDYPGAKELADGYVCLQLIEDAEKRISYIETFKRLWEKINQGKT